MLIMLLNRKEIRLFLRNLPTISLTEVSEQWALTCISELTHEDRCALRIIKWTPKAMCLNIHLKSRRTAEALPE